MTLASPLKLSTSDYFPSHSTNYSSQTTQCNISEMFSLVVYSYKSGGPWIYPQAFTCTKRIKAAERCSRRVFCWDFFFKACVKSVANWWTCSVSCSGTLLAHGRLLSYVRESYSVLTIITFSAVGLILIFFIMRFWKDSWICSSLHEFYW